MTSHEMRNPLSALIGCADEIIHSLTDFRKALTFSNSVIETRSPHTDSSESARAIHLLDEAIEAAETIVYCAMHQKR